MLASWAKDIRPLGDLGSLGATGVRFVVRDAIVIAAVSKLFLRLVAVSR